LSAGPTPASRVLFNALVGAARAIVTDVPGTTRDLLVERVDIGGLAITLVDTAGLREARDAIEAEGVRRARDAQDVAALKLVVIDGSAPLTVEDRALVADTPAPRVIVTSKIDAARAWAAGELGRTGPTRLRYRR
jgi:tRNA modification GTPase